MTGRAVAVIVVVQALVLGMAVYRTRRLRRRLDAASDQTWLRAWRALDRSERRRIERAVRQGEVLDDPHDAELAVGAAERAKRHQDILVRRLRWWHLVLPVAVLLIPLTAGDTSGAIRLAAPAAVAVAGTLLLRLRIAPRGRARIRAAAKKNRRRMESERRRRQSIWGP